MTTQQKVYNIIPQKAILPRVNNVIKVMRLLAEFYGVGLKIHKPPKNRKRWAGWASEEVTPEGRLYEIHIMKDSNTYLSTFFHELGHVYCRRNNIWKSYHHPAYWRKNQWVFICKGLKGAISTGYRAECWIDRWAKKEMALWFPKIKYSAGYEGNPSTKKWLYDNHLINFKKILDQRKERK